MAALRLQALQIRADLRIRPVRIAHQLAPHNALAVDDVRLRPAVGVVQLRSRLLGVAYCDQVNVVALNKPRVRVRIFIDADRENRQIRLVMVQRQQPRRLLNAGRALRPPD